MPTNTQMLFGKNKVFFVDRFSDLPLYGEEENLYIVRLDDEDHPAPRFYEWRENVYQDLVFNGGEAGEDLNRHKTQIASEKELGHVMVDSKTIQITPEGIISSLASANNVGMVMKNTFDELPSPLNAEFNTLYIVLRDITNENKTTMYVRDGNDLILLAAFNAIGAIQEYTQVTKLGVMASESSPKMYGITIPRSENVLRAPIEVLKFIRGNTGVVYSAISFDNNDESDFEWNENIEFNGKMQLKKTKLIDMLKDDSWNGEGSLYKKLITRNERGGIQKINLPNYTSLNKTLILHDGEYKKWNKNWQVVSTSPTQVEFLSEGMDSLSPLLDRRVETLEPLPMTDKTSILLGSESEGKVFSKTVDLGKYMDIRNIKVEVR